MTSAHILLIVLGLWLVMFVIEMRWERRKRREMQAQRGGCPPIPIALPPHPPPPAPPPSTGG